MPVGGNRARRGRGGWLGRATGRGEQGPGRKLPLRIGTLNIGGIAQQRCSPVKVLAAARAWAEARLDVICLQETHHTSEHDVFKFTQDLGAAAQHLHVTGWEVAAYSLSGSTHTAGVAILIRKGLEAEVSTVQALPGGPAQGNEVPAEMGRLTMCSVHWGGHKLRVASVYLPAGQLRAAREQMIRGSLANTVPAAAAAGEQLIWAGDFNFVEDPERDSTAGRGGRPADRASATARQQTASSMVDCHRVLHPTRRDLSHLHRGLRCGGARLDRIYVGDGLADWVTRSYISCASPSDHRLVCAHILPQSPPARGKGIRRVRMHFAAHPDLLAGMREWVADERTRAPATPAQLVAWWPGFKARLTAQAARANATAQRRRIRPGQRSTAAKVAVQQAEQTALAAPTHQETIAALVNAQAGMTEALRAEAQPGAFAARIQALRSGERPSPALTQFVHGCTSSCPPTALRTPSGQLVTDPASIPGVIAEFWRDISKAPDGQSPEEEAQRAADRQAVLAALAADAGRLSPEQAEAAGSGIFTLKEVATALRHTAPGKAPGWDGIPTDLFRKLWGPMGQLLTDLFSAIGSTKQLPAGFLEGSISVLHKKGDRTAPGNYRPITLLCADYRLLTKVLATRLGKALSSVISPEQCAFLPQRRIGASIFLLRHLPHLLRVQHRSAVIAFLDFAKAYDTVDRSFLFETMAVMGAGEGLLQWAALLLGDTQARARVNGYASQRVRMEAGVRQGCPLSPLLYLFVGQALLSWLRQQGLGIELVPASGQRTTAAQYADDAEALLPSLGEVPAFREAMSRFGRASGQWLNMDKVELLQVGAPAAALPAAGQRRLQPQQGAVSRPAAVVVEGMRVVETATALGLPISNSCLPPQPDWGRLMQPAMTRMQRIAHLSLSIFGRAAAVGAYALAMVTWHMEHGGPPPGQGLADLASKAAAVVDRRKGPLDRVAAKRWVGVPSALLHGSPAVGGFGLLPLREHLHAREALWATQLALWAVAEPGAQPHPWVTVVAAYLRLRSPAVQLWAVLTARPGERPWPGAGESWPEDIRRIVTGLAHLPPAVDVGEEQLELGPWCASAPLWGNVAFPNAAGADGPRGLEHVHQALACCSKLQQLGDLVRALEAAPGDRDMDGVRGAEWLATYVGPPANAPMALATPGMALGRIRALAALICPSWLTAAGQGVRAGAAGGGSATAEEAMRIIISRLGWRVGGAGGNSTAVPLRKLTVRVATQLQLGEMQRRRQQLKEAYVQEACEGLPGGSQVRAAKLEAFTVGQSRRWAQVKWEAEHKEVMWRLAVDGVPLPGNTHLRNAPTEACGCGAFGGVAELQQQQGSPRTHHFWACPVAKAVRRQIEGHLGAPIGRHHVWLGEAPPGCHEGPWDVVALAALEAMEAGRVVLRTASGEGRRRLLGRARDATGEEQEDPSSQWVTTACTKAVARFWSALRSFAALGVPKKGWRDVGHDHPILWVEEGRVGCAEPLGLGQELGFPVEG